MEFTKIPLDEQSRMLRAGAGRNHGNWFVRIDLWWAGFRVSFNERQSHWIDVFFFFAINITLGVLIAHHLNARLKH